jgi:excisionase family DNA binding protein
MAQLINMSINNSVPTEPHDFLTTREAAELLGVALRTVQLWVEAGTLSAWKTAGGHRRITRESVEAMLKRQTAARQGSIVADHSPRGFHILVVDDDANDAGNHGDRHPQLEPARHRQHGGRRLCRPAVHR